MLKLLTVLLIVLEFST